MPQLPVSPRCLTRYLAAASQWWRRCLSPRYLITWRITRSTARYVDDVARAFDVVMHKGVIGDIYNIGTKVRRAPVERF